MSGSNSSYDPSAPILTGFDLIASKRRPPVTGTRQDKIVQPTQAHQTLRQLIFASTRFSTKFKCGAGRPVSLTGPTPAGACQELLTRGDIAW